MKHQALRPVALMLSVMLAAAAPVKAGTIQFADVLRIAAEGRRGPATDLRLRAIQQQGGRATATGVASATQDKNGADKTSSGSTATTPDGAAASGTSIIGQDPGQSQQGGTVETVDLGDVTGTVCDCGEIPYDIPEGGFPKWPLLALAGIPLFFIDRDDNPPGTPPPGPTPPPPPAIPEPATLLLFGSGLLALGARGRRRRRAAQSSLGVKTSDAEVV